MVAPVLASDIREELHVLWDAPQLTWGKYRKYSEDEVQDKVITLPRKYRDRSTFLLDLTQEEVAAADKLKAVKRRKKKGGDMTTNQDTVMFMCKVGPAKALISHCRENNLLPVQVSKFFSEMITK